MNDIMTSLLGTITLPLMILLALGAMVGAKPETIIKPFFDLLTASITGITKLTFNLVRLAYQSRQEFTPPYRRPHIGSHQSAKGGRTL